MRAESFIYTLVVTPALIPFYAYSKSGPEARQTLLPFLVKIQLGRSDLQLR